MKDMTDIYKFLSTELRKGPKSAKTLAKKMKCSINGAKRRVAKLANETDEKVKQGYMREGERGPESLVYYIEPEAA